jgi:hypothetical protein
LFVARTFVVRSFVVTPFAGTFTVARLVELVALAIDITFLPCRGSGAALAEIALGA